MLLLEVLADPGEEALDGPAPGLDGEADLVGVLANDLDGDGGGAGNPLPGVAAVGEDLRDEGKGVARGRQHGPAAVAVLDVGRVRFQHQGTTVGVDEGVALSALDLLAGVVAPRPAGLRRLDALAVEHPRRRAGGAPAARAVEHDQMVVQPLQNAVVAQPQEPAVDCLPRREAVGQEPPGATGSEHVEDRVHDLPHRPRSRPSRQARRRQVRLQQSPLLVAHIACVTQVLAAMPPTGGRGPHEAVQTGFDNRPESHLAPAIHPRQTFRDSLLKRELNEFTADRFCFSGEEDSTAWVVLLLGGLIAGLRSAAAWVAALTL